MAEMLSTAAGVACVGYIAGFGARSVLSFTAFFVGSFVVSLVTAIARRET